MADNDDLMIEVTGSSSKAASALDKVIVKVTQMQEAIERVTPSLSKFTERLDSITAGSKAFSMLEKLTKGTGDLSGASKKAEANEAMYQARLDRANTSIARSQVQTEKLAAAKQRLAEIDAMTAKNSTAFSMSPEEFTTKYDHTNKGGIDLTPDIYPGESEGPTPPGAPSKTASQIFSENTPKAEKMQFDTSQAQTALAQVQAFIDQLTPSISHMSSSAQAEFNALSSKLQNVSQKIDNQRGLYHNLASAATQAAQASGEGSNAYLNIEKRMLSADSAIDRLIEKQDELKAQMSGVASASEKVGLGMTMAGEQGERAAKKSTSAWSGTMKMMEKMFIRIAAFRIFSAISQGIVTGIQDMAQANTQANATMSALATNSLYLKNSIGAALMPVLQSLIPILNQITDALTSVFNTIAMLTARIFNHSQTAVIAQRANVNYAQTVAGIGNKAKDTTKKVKELQQTIMSFDELNVLKKPTSDTDTPKPGTLSGGKAGMPSYGNMFKAVKVPEWVNNIGNVTDQVGKVISSWWNSLTSAQKWGAGIGGTAGFIIGGIVGRLIGGPIGQIVGAVLGAAAGVAIGVWWAGLTSKEKWGAGIGAGAGAVIGGIIGGMIGGPVGIAVGAALGGAAGAAIGKWYSDLSTKQQKFISTTAVSTMAIMNPWLTTGVVIGAVVNKLASSSISVKKFGDNVSSSTAQAVSGFMELYKGADGNLKLLEWSGDTVTKDMANKIKKNIDGMASQTVSALNKQKSDSVAAIQGLATKGSGITKSEMDTMIKDVNRGYDNRIKAEQNDQSQINKILENASSHHRSLNSSERSAIEKLKSDMYSNGIKALSKNEVEEKAIYENMRVNHTALSAQEAAAIVKDSKTTTDNIISDANNAYNKKVAAIIRERDETHSISSDEADKLIKAAGLERDGKIKAAKDAHEKVVNEAKKQSGDLVNQVDWQNGQVKSKWTVFWDWCGSTVKKNWSDLGNSVKKGWNDFWGWYNQSVKKNWSDFGKQIQDGWNKNVTPWFTKEKWQKLGSNAINGLIAPFKNIHWPKISFPHLEWTSGGWQATGWIKQTLSALHLPTQMPKLDVKWYANGGLFNAPTIAGLGEAGPEAALPLNDKVFSQIAQGIQRNSDQGSSEEVLTQMGNISKRLESLEKAILERPVNLYSDDRKIAQSANNGNRILGRTYPVAT